jgi:hypothetical protein
LVGNRLCKPRNKVPVYTIYCEPEVLNIHLLFRVLTARLWYVYMLIEIIRNTT